MTDGVDERGVPLPPQPWQYGERISAAMTAAAQIHANQIREGTTIPYLSHLLGTCAIAFDYGASEDEAIAALLHDAIEDGQPTEAARTTVWGFGDEVGRIVEGCTDADTHPKPPWRERKERYLASLADEDRAVLLVSASDRLHNARSSLRDLRLVGDDLRERFSATQGRDALVRPQPRDGLPNQPRAHACPHRRTRPDRGRDRTVGRGSVLPGTASRVRQELPAGPSA